MMDGLVVRKVQMPSWKRLLRPGVGNFRLEGIERALIPKIEFVPEDRRP
jgi:hypothetical protein